MKRSAALPLLLLWSVALSACGEGPANEQAEPDCTISAGAVAVHVVQAREELVAARAARALL